jgi:hypothetical protein
MPTTELATAYGILADNPDVLTEVLRDHPAVKDALLAGVPILHITLPCCGAAKVYERLEDVPRENVGPCKCGNWFIYYRSCQHPISIEEA